MQETLIVCPIWDHAIEPVQGVVFVGLHTPRIAHCSPVPIYHRSLLAHFSAIRTDDPK